jgi:D-alanyl-D-alanine carboxypeptidase
VLSQDRAGAAWYPASLTKLMTAYLTFQALREGKLTLDQQITVSAIANMQEPSKIGVGAGRKVSVDFALQALLVHSANDMAVVLAEAVGGDLPSFVLKMNRTAKQIGMTGTRFLNPHGLHNPDHYSTARDLALLAAKVHQDFPGHRHYFDQEHMTAGKRKLRNTNALLRLMKEADGMKTGFICPSGFNLVASATRDGRTLMAVVLGASSGTSRAEWAKSLLELGSSGRGAQTSLGQIVNLPLPDEGPPDISREVCGGGRGIGVRSAKTLKGYGVSLGRYEKREEASRVLRIWSDAGDAHAKDAARGLVQLPKSSGYTAMVWDLEAEEAEALCRLARERNNPCDVMRPETLKSIADQARAAKPAGSKTKRRKKRSS